MKKHKTDTLKNKNFINRLKKTQQIELLEEFYTTEEQLLTNNTTYDNNNQNNN